LKTGGLEGSTHEQSLHRIVVDDKNHWLIVGGHVIACQDFGIN
jgi:hypothetical protein